MQRNYGALVSAVCTLNCLQMIEKKFMVLINYDLIIFPLYFLTAISEAIAVLRVANVRIDTGI